MNKLMYAALVSLTVMAIVMFTRAAPEATASLSERTNPAVDVGQMHRALDMDALPNGDVDEGYRAD